jgi:polysaccharide export outer membrane protein
MNVKVKLVLVAMLTMVAGVCFGQSTSGQPYKLKQEDVLRIQVYGRQEISAEIPVGQDGTISAPFLGAVPAEGKTIAELQNTLYVMYKSKLFLRDPIISVTIVQFRRLRANVSGQVNRSTELIFRPGDTVLTLLAAGGGVIPERADSRRATLRRRSSKEIIPIDLFALTVLGDNTQNFQLEDGDELIVPEEQRNRINVIGAVRQPGLYGYRESMKLADAISLANGEIRYTSRMSRCFVMRELPGRPGQYLRIDCDYVKFVKSGDWSQNVKLMPGDIVVVPETNTPDFNQLQALANTLFVFKNIGSIFGIGG